MPSAGAAGGDERLPDLGDVPVGAADAVRVRRSEDLARRGGVVLRLLPAPLGPDGEHRDDVGGIDDAGGDARARGSSATVLALQPGAAMRVAPTRRSRCLPPFAADRKLGHAVGPRLGKSPP